MFVGSVPRPVVDQILRTVDFGAWGGVFVCCSGSFRVDRAIKAKWPDARLISNDVSLYSVSLGRLVTNEPFSIRFTGRLAFIEQAVDVDDFEGRVAAVLVAHEMATYRGTNVWAQAHFRHYVDGFGDYLAGAKAKLCTFRERMRIDGFTARDFRYHADVATGTGDKLTRAQPFAAQVEAGNVSYVQGPWNEPYLQEMHRFDGKAKPMDQVDASSGAFNRLTLQKPKPRARALGRPLGAR